MDRSARSRIAIAVLPLLLSACSAAPGDSIPPGANPSASASASPSSVPVVVSPSPMASTVSAAPTIAATPTPAATQGPPTDLARVVVAERDRIRVRIELQRNPLPAGEPSWVKITVTNRGDGPVTWFHDGCSLQAVIYGPSTVAWPMGIDHDGQAGRFKTEALGGSIVDAPSPFGSIMFVKESGLRSTNPGCADVGIGERIAPRAHLKQTLWWSGFTTLNHALPPDGPLRLTVFAAHYWRGTDDPERVTDQSIPLELDAWITGAPPERPSPAQVVDSALADSAFAAYVETQSIANGRASLAWYDADLDRWEVGIMPGTRRSRRGSTVSSSTARPGPSWVRWTVHGTARPT